MQDQKDLSMLVTLFTATELTGELNSTGPFTVFAPINTAFAVIRAETRQDMIELVGKDKLTDLLKYHIIHGKRLSAKNIKSMNLPAKVETWQGLSLTVQQNGTALMVDDAYVVTADLNATNGIIHLIDTVLMPSSANMKSAFQVNQPFLFAFIYIVLPALLGFF